MNCLNITEEKILNHSMTTVSGVDYIQTRRRILENLQVIHDKICRSRTITQSTAKKFANVG